MNKILETGEKFFGTKTDPTQIPIARASVRKLLQLHPKAFLYKTDDTGDPICWTAIVPTTKNLMNKFLAGKITEKQLFDMTEPQESYDAIYLCAALTVPEHRKKGYAFELLVDAVGSIPVKGKLILFSWPITKEGKTLAKRIGERFKTNVLIQER